MQQLENEFLQSGGEFIDTKMSELFKVEGNPQLNKDSFVFDDNAPYPYFTRSVLNNGVAGYVEYLDDDHLISGGRLAIGMLGMQFFYMEKDFYAGQFTKSIVPKGNKIDKFSNGVAQYFIVSLNRFQSIYQGGLVRDFTRLFNNTVISVPFIADKVATDFAENYIRVFESERLEVLKSYLTRNNLYSTTLTDAEQKALTMLNENARGGVELLNWKSFNLKQTFGEATRGKRLKKSDRIVGDLPFVTAGETDMGIAGFIANDVDIFSKNTVTIDMFGSAKYRNYDYGADDHVAVVDTQNLPKDAVIFIASAINKSSNNGQFSYGRNFYAKDANNLNILLPVKDNHQPDLEFMSNVIRAIEKTVIKKVVGYMDSKFSS